MKHIRLYLITLFIACSMFMVCPFAYADTISDAENYFDSYFSGYPQSSFTWFSSNCNQFIIYDVVNNNVHYKVLEGYNTSGVFNTHIPSNNYWYQTYATFSSDGRLVQASSYDVTPKGFYIINDGHNNYRQWGFQTATSESPWSWQGDYIFTTASYDYYGTNISFSSGSWFLDFTDYYATNDIYVDSGNGTYILKESNSIQYTEDERLKLYKLWSSQNGDSLVVDLSAFRSYTPAAAYEFSDIVITLTSNGVDTDYNLPLSSSTVNNGWDNNSNLYTISTPVTDFTLSDTYDTYITKVSFSLDVSSPGGSGSTPFYISTNFPLDVHHSSVTPGVVPTPVYTDPTVKSDNDLSQIVYYLNNTGINYSGEFLMMQGLPDIPVWANRYTETIFKMSNDSVENAGEFITEPSYNIVTGWSYNVIDIFDYFNSIIDNYDNVYDVFVFPVDYYRSYNEQLSVLYEDLGIQGYIVFFTNRYYNHQNSLNTVDILSVIQKDANNFVDFVEYMQVRLDDFESKSLEILNPLYDETTYIDDKLASILYAVNNIESYNDSSIVSLLTDIKGLLSSPANEIDTPQECIQLYEAHPDYFNELWGAPTRSTAANNQFSGSEYVRADLVPAWWEGKTLTMIYILKNDGETSRFYNDILNGLFDSYENLIESDNSFNTFIDSLFKTGYDYTDSFYGHLFDLSYNPESWDGGFAENE